MNITHPDLHFPPSFIEICRVVLILCPSEVRTIQYVKSAKYVRISSIYKKKTFLYITHDIYDIFYSQNVKMTNCQIVTKLSKLSKCQNRCKIVKMSTYQTCQNLKLSKLSEVPRPLKPSALFLFGFHWQF